MIITCINLVNLLITGELTLTDRLDYEVATDYTLAVTAYNDEGAPAGHMVARCMVYVTVIDENDHAPHIRITTVGDDSTARVSMTLEATLL